ncbi:MAG: response regulator transcription factor [Candidatus Sericytochromatia bacterium]|nr:response regulator transcription factor [Candidatus Tanganyikabacteria bacterium]
MATSARLELVTRKLLLIDDDRDLARLLGDFVRLHGFELIWADRPSAGVSRLADAPDLLLLDVMLPERDGFEVCRELRASGVQTPVIMLTARGDDLDRIRGLNLGADDYLPKPFNPVELIARVEAVLRRAARPDQPRKGQGLDPDTRAFRLGDREVPLTPSEYRIMQALTGSPGRAFTRDQLLDLLDDAGAIDAFDRAIDIHVSRLRSKIEPEPRRPRHLLTVRGVGYRFEW